jgi:hypothetical protein
LFLIDDRFQMGCQTVSGVEICRQDIRLDPPAAVLVLQFFYSRRQFLGLISEFAGEPDRIRV